MTTRFATATAASGASNRLPSTDATELKNSMMRSLLKEFGSAVSRLSRQSSQYSVRVQSCEPPVLLIIDIPDKFPNVPPLVSVTSPIHHPLFHPDTMQLVAAVYAQRWRSAGESSLSSFIRYICTEIQANPPKIIPKVAPSLPVEIANRHRSLILQDPDFSDVLNGLNDAELDQVLRSEEIISNKLNDSKAMKEVESLNIEMENAVELLAKKNLEFKDQIERVKSEIELQEKKHGDLEAEYEALNERMRSYASSANPATVITACDGIVKEAKTTSQELESKMKDWAANPTRDLAELDGMLDSLIQSRVSFYVGRSVYDELRKTYPR